MMKNAIVVAAMLGFASVAFADDAVKAGGASDKPARAIEEGANHTGTAGG